MTLNEMDVNYFICTLGQAALPDISRPFRSVIHLIDRLAQDYGQLPAVGFYMPNGQHEEYAIETLTFQQIRQGVIGMANAIADKVSIPASQTVGLLSNSSPAFLFTWLGLMWLGHPVLLIAPQCSASGIAQLSKTCNASVLLHDEVHEKLARDASIAQINYDLTIQRLPFEDDQEVFRIARQKSIVYREPSQVSGDIAYLHHTSGTSSGIPKPISHSHIGGIAVLPQLDGSATATFTTTPLYHGGVADLFRAWSSTALIWLFPSQHFPITATNIVKCLEASEVAANKAEAPPVKYFSSVPYVLQMLAQDSNGIAYLRGMDIVGVGGAALPPEIGNQLVNNDVNLVSRYGSAECGFLMSSHRNYRNDKEWQYLRKSEHVQKLKFEKNNDWLNELVVLKDWPHIAKTNREDGSFATSDLFVPHPSIPGAWKYHSRADSQLTLNTGKKFDPAPLEGSLAASLPTVSEIMIFGNGQPYPGAFVFRSEKGKKLSDHDIIEGLAPVVEELNRESQSHARIPRNMLVPLPFDVPPLEKSSKGTILRGRAEERFQSQIEDAYQKTSFVNDDLPDEELPSAILKLIDSIVGSSPSDNDILTEDTDLFWYGVDSVACIQIRHALAQLIPDDVCPLPLSIVEDSGTVTNLARFVSLSKKGEEMKHANHQSEQIKDLVEKYSSFTDVSSPPPDEKIHGTGYTILLTGPTGLLGAHMTSQLLADSRVEKIYLLVRGASLHAARERVMKSLGSRMLASSGFDEKVHVLPCKLSDPRLGLSDDDYQLLQREADKIFHLAWSVNFLVSLKSLASTHLAGLQNLLNLAIGSARDPSFVYSSSIASVSNLKLPGKVPESVIEDFNACGSTGYAQSKLAAELICSNCSKILRMRNRVTVIRVGQLSGDSKTGIWNMSEAYPLMLASSKATRLLPALRDEVLNWLPVDIAATCFIDAGFAVPNDDDDPVDSITVLNLLNTSNATTFPDIIQTLQRSGEQIRAVPVKQWLEALEALQHDESTQHHPALKLLPFWKKIYGTGVLPPREIKIDNNHATAGRTAEAKHGQGDGTYATIRSERAMPCLKSAIGPLMEGYLLKIWNWVRNNA